MGVEDGEMNMAEYWFPVNVKYTEEAQKYTKNSEKGLSKGMEKVEWEQTERSVGCNSTTKRTCRPIVFFSKARQLSMFFSLAKQWHDNMGL